MSVNNAIPLQYKDLFWKGTPPTEVADVLYMSVPNLVACPLAARLTSRIAELDKDLLDGLHRVGFKTNMGIEGTGVFRLALRAGGTYLNVGASDMIIDGRLKLKNDSLIESFTSEGLKFVDGSVLPADAIICATGYDNVRPTIERMFGKEFCSVLKEKFWDWNEEGEMNGVWRDSGHDGFYVAYGNFLGARFYSKFLALQIKAIEMGVFGKRYTLE